MNFLTLFLSAATLAGMTTAVPAPPPNEDAAIAFSAAAVSLDAAAAAAGGSGSWLAACHYPNGKCNKGLRCVLDPLCLSRQCERWGAGRCL